MPVLVAAGSGLTPSAPGVCSVLPLRHRESAGYTDFRQPFDVEQGKRCRTGIAKRQNSGSPRNDALTDFWLVMRTVQVLPFVVSHPVQPVKSEASAGVAVNVTLVLTT